jgi:cell division transport system permease protein
MFLYYLKETFNSLFRAKFASLLIILTTTVAIVFVTFSIALVAYSNTINKKLKENIKISLFLSDTLSEAQTKKVGEKVFSNLFVNSYKYVSKKEALEKMKEKTGEDFFNVLEKNPLPASFAIKLNPDSVSYQSIKSIIATLKKIKGVDEVVYDYSLTLKVLNYLNESKKIIYFLGGFLILLSIYLVYSNNRLMLSSRLDQYNTMKLVGAKLSAIKVPILLNGIVMGLIAALLCIGLYFLAINLIAKFYRSFQMEEINYYLIGITLALGILLGFIGSFLSTLKISLKIKKV